MQVAVSDMQIYLTHSCVRLIVNLHPAGGWGWDVCLTPLPRGLSKIAKNDGAKLRRFLHTLSTINFAPFLKNLSPGHLRSSDLTF